MPVSLRGNLEDFGIADVFQLIGQQRKTGILEFSGHTETIQILFARGAVVSAAPVGSWPDAALAEMLKRCGTLTSERVEELFHECEKTTQTPRSVALGRGWLDATELREIEDLLTRETIFSVLRWSVGSFDFTATRIEHDRDPGSLLGAEQILMDGLRMVDEWQSFAGLVPSENMVFETSTPPESLRQSIGDETDGGFAAIERVFLLIDGHLDVRCIIDRSRLGTFDAVRVLANLHRRRLIEVVKPAETKTPDESELRRNGGRRWVGGLAAVVPMALLVALSALPWMLQSTDVSDAFEIQRPALLETARRSFAERRIRHAREIYRLETGRWPSSLDVLEEHELLTPAALALERGRPYH